ncbi:MAG TPA: cation-transporting P-type ATPase, partial [Ornithinibacter sp.]|nr:cation-transporting P-type ATPase [Ornithinibacter sp.]
MSDIHAAAPSTPAEGAPPFASTVDAVLTAAGSDAGSGLSSTEADARLASHGPNAITAEKPPSPWAVAAALLRDPMNLMLVAVVVVSLLIGEVSTGVLVGLLVVLNIALGT